MSEIDSADMGPWLSPEDLEFVRRKVPIVYVDVVPIRLDDDGTCAGIGMLLRVDETGISREFPSGRVLFHEPIRDALARHIEKDLGNLSLARLPHSITPFSVQEYFPTPGTRAEDLQDARQHRVDLSYIVPIDGTVNPGNDALEFTWFTLGEVKTPELQAEMSPGHASLLRRALAELGEI